MPTETETNTPCVDVIRLNEQKPQAIVKATIRQEKVKGMRVIDRKKKTSKKASKRVREADVYLLAKLIYCEVGAVREDEVLYLCGSVVLNRIKDKRYPNTLEGVIYQSGQWEVTWNGAFNYKKPDKRCLKVARDLLKHGVINPEVNGMSERVWGKFYKRFGNVVFSIS